ncbi:MAG TPA: ATP-binding protein, partial [Acidiferrobacteraceae bacterium]|nr:ATP-binding protein [Acidiferrobacteraceae bacterium]
DEQWKLLTYFNIYRLIIAGAASAAALLGVDAAPFGTRAPRLFLITSVVYLVVGISAAFLARRRRGDFTSLADTLALIDIILLTLLMHASGGIANGGLLLIVAVAGNGFMLAPRMSVFLAAVATVGALIENSWGYLTQQPLHAESYPQVGMFGVGLFATAAIAYFFSGRLRATEVLAEQRGIDLANLAQINDFIVERMQAGVLVVDPAGKLRTRNKTALQFLGLPALAAGAPLGQTLPELATEIEDWKRNPIGYKRKLLRTRAGYVLLPRFLPIGAQAHSGIIVFLEDTGVLRQQAQQLKMAALARLTASIAHEIRNPLGAISNASQLLGESLPEDDQNRRLLRIIEDQGRRMNVIVENVLQLGRRDQVRMARIDLGSWLERFANRYCETLGLDRRALVVEAAEQMGVCVDPEQLDQVVSNLCQNALRHSPPFSGPPLIRLSAGRLPDLRAHLDVVDAGSGVPADIVDNIFDPFFTTTPRGTGLGLYIAKELCEGNGARLDYEPAEPQGSRFRVTFSRNEECSGLNL